MTFSFAPALALAVAMSVVTSFTTSPIRHYRSPSSPSSPINMNINKNKNMIGRPPITPGSSFLRPRLKLRSSDSDSDSNSDSNTPPPPPPPHTNPEVQRLLAQASALRSQAATLESEQAAASLALLTSAFSSFDTDNSGGVDLSELRLGLNKAFKTSFPPGRVEQLMRALDGDEKGELTIGEFQTPRRMKAKLEEIIREEKEKANEMSRRALEEEERAKFEVARLEVSHLFF